MALLARWPARRPGKRSFFAFAFQPPASSSELKLQFNFPFPFPFQIHFHLQRHLRVCAANANANAKLAAKLAQESNFTLELAVHLARAARQWKPPSRMLMIAGKQVASLALKPLSPPLRLSLSFVLPPLFAANGKLPLPPAAPKSARLLPHNGN